MRSRLVRFLGLTTLMFSLQFLNFGCSSSSSGEGQEEEVAANAEGEEEVAANEEGEQESANNETNGAETNGLANNAEGESTNNNLGAEQNAENNGLNDGGNALAENNQGQQSNGGEEDLQQIIEEMNTASNSQLPAPNNAGAMEDVSNGSNSGGLANTAASTEMNQAVPEAAAPMGGAVSGTPAGPGLPELGSKMSYIVQKGDTLAKIAARIYGDSNKWTEIANFTGLANPRLIYPGDVVYYQLTEQSMAFAGTYDSVRRSEVQIQQGDTLATIAGRVFGNSSLWKLIWRQNDRIDNPDRLTAGSTLFYVDPASLAKMENKAEQKIVKSKNPTKSSNSKLVTSQPKPVKKAIYEVANDHLNDLFSQTVSKDLLKRT
jgi:nucleoid-associated protein YgaU